MTPVFGLVRMFQKFLEQEGEILLVSLHGNLQHVDLAVDCHTCPIVSQNVTQGM